MRFLGPSSLVAATCCALLGASCQGAGGAAPRLQSRAELAALPPAEADSAATAASLLFTYAGCGHVLRDCLAVHPTCAHAPRELRLLAALAKAGATAAEAVSEAQGYYRSFDEPAAQVDLSQAACRGAADAPVTVVVFSDFECPACSLARLTLEALADDPRVRLCFKYFPLDSHAHSRQTAQAAEFARREGRFWELHDQMFDHQDDLGLDRLAELAAAVGLDAAALRRAVEENRYLDLVNGSKAEGKALGVTGTPTVLFNGHPFPLPLDGVYLRQAIEDHAEHARGGWTRD